MDCFVYSLCEIQGEQWNSVCKRKDSSLFPSRDKSSSLLYQVVTVAIEMVYLYVFFCFFPLGIYLWLFSSNRCSSKTSVRIRQLWKYLWAEKCKVGSNTKQWHGPHPPEVSRLAEWWTLETLKGRGHPAFLTVIKIISYGILFLYASCWCFLFSF